MPALQSEHPTMGFPISSCPFSTTLRYPQIVKSQISIPCVPFVQHGSGQVGPPKGTSSPKPPIVSVHWGVWSVEKSVARQSLECARCPRCVFPSLLVSFLRPKEGSPTKKETCQPRGRGHRCRCPRCWRICRSRSACATRSTSAPPAWRSGP